MSLLIASITPVIIFMFLIYRKDTIKEPFLQLLKAFLGGVLSVILTLLIGIFLIYSVSENFIESAFFKSFYDAFISAALVEEGCKFFFLYLFIWNSKHFDQKYDGIIYAVFVSLGFALVENILYVYQNGMTTAISRAVLAVPGHGFFAVIMGYYFSLAKFHDNTIQRKVLFIKAIIFPVIIHGLYDFCLMYATHKNADILFGILLMFVFTGVVIGFWIVGIRNIKKHIQKDREQGLINS